MRSISSRCPIVFTNVLSPEGRCEAHPGGVQLRLFTFIEFWVRKGILDFKNQKGLSCLFIARKCFIPRREMRSISSRFPIVFTYVLIFGLGMVYDTFKITILRLAFCVLESVVSPQRRCVEHIR